MLKLITFTLMAIAPDASGDMHAYELDAGLSGRECTARIEAMAATGLVELIPGREWIGTQNVSLQCEAVAIYGR
jgi:hypothetical protein